MKQIFAIAVMAFSAVAIASGQEQDATRDSKGMVEQVIRKLDNERIQTQIHADAAALERIYADDFIGVGPSGTVRTKPQVISDFTADDLRFQSITTDDVRVRVYGNAAVETGLSTMDGQDKGKAVPPRHSLHQSVGEAARPLAISRQSLFVQYPASVKIDSRHCHFECTRDVTPSDPRAKKLLISHGLAPR